MISVIVLTDLEIAQAQYYSNGEQTIMALLQEKGAPIEGVIWRSLKKGWTVRRENDQINNETIFTFSKPPSIAGPDARLVDET